jgi:hypothetical protein
LVKDCFSRGTELRITADLQENSIVDFTGRVAFSSLICLGWYLIGLRFSKEVDERLVPTNQPGRIQVIELG